MIDIIDMLNEIIEKLLTTFLNFKTSLLYDRLFIIYKA